MTVDRKPVQVAVGTQARNIGILIASSLMAHAFTNIALNPGENGALMEN
jgi:hypothetical protein